MQRREVNIIKRERMSKLTALDRGVRKSVHTDRVSSQNKISLKSMSGENSNPAFLFLTRFSWWLTAKHLFWSLLGMAEVDSLNSVDEATVTLCKVLYAIYLVVAGVLLMNMMIALLSNTYQRVEVRYKLLLTASRSNQNSRTNPEFRFGKC